MKMLAASVSVHGTRVGQLDRLSDEDQVYVFHFDPEWLDDPHRPTLGQLFEDRRPDSICSSGLPAWFAHLLPQGPWGRAINRSLGLGDDCGELELLLAIGDDLPGAVTLDPAMPRVLGPGGLAPRPDEPTGGMHFSLAGVQWKLSLRKGERGLVVPVRGENGDFIAKFPDEQFPGVTRVELAITRWAQLSGIQTSQVRSAIWDELESVPDALKCVEDTFLLSERFDRGPAGKVHFEDMGQVFGKPPGEGPGGQYGGSYEQLATVLQALTPDDMGEYFNRLVFMVISGNGDAHLKNWGVLYPDRRNPVLSPAYDLVSSVLYRFNDGLALTLDGKSAFQDIQEATFLCLAKRLKFERHALVQRVRQARERILDVWRSSGSDLGLNEREKERMERHLARTPLALGR